MERHTENDLVIPSLLYLAGRTEGKATTRDLRTHLEATLPLTPIDREKSQGGQTRFSQIARNLKSNNKLSEFGVRWIKDQRGGYWHLPNLSSELHESISLLGSGQFEADGALAALDDLRAAEGAGTPLCVLDEEVREGDQIAGMCFSRSRSAELRRQAIAHFEAQGTLVCIVCEFDFLRSYGELGRAFIEIHHKRPLSAYLGGELVQALRDALANLAPLCANCHRMVHRRRPPIDITALREVVQNRSRQYSRRG